MLRKCFRRLSLRNFCENLLINLEKVAETINSNATADPSLHKALKKLKVNDLPEPDDIGDVPDLPVPKKFPVKCTSKGCCLRHGDGTKLFCSDPRIDLRKGSSLQA